MKTSGTLFFDGKKMHFSDLTRIRIHCDEKIWCYDKGSDTKLTFKVIELPEGATGKWLKWWRASKGWNQTKAGDFFEVSQAFVSDVERGKKTISEKMSQKIIEDYERKRAKISSLNLI